MTLSIDKQWFMDRWAEKGLTLRKVAKLIDMDPSALSKTLSGERQMKIVEVDKIATVMGLSQSTVLSHVTANLAGPKSAEREPIQAAQGLRGRRHPLFGCLKGALTVPPGVDLTEPADPELAGYLDRKYGAAPRGSR
jgi:transcriptional regulator with XRE-family HTH domain